MRVEYGRLYSGDSVIVKGVFSSNREAREAAEDLTARKLANGFRMRESDFKYLIEEEYRDGRLNMLIPSSNNLRVLLGRELPSEYNESRSFLLARDEEDEDDLVALRAGQPEEQDHPEFVDQEEEEFRRAIAESLKEGNHPNNEGADKEEEERIRSRGIQEEEKDSPDK